VIRTFDEINLQRLSWFFTWPGMLLVLAGVVVVALRRRWSPSAWLVTVPTVVLMAFYMWHTLNSPYFMWVGRRYVPSVVPGMVLLIALALAALWAWRVRLRPGGRLRLGVPLAVALVAFVGGVQLSQSLPLRGHDELGGSSQVAQSVAALSGAEQGIYLWAPVTECCAQPAMMFGSPVWLIGEQDSALLPSGRRVGPYVRQYARTFPDRPLFVVYPAGTPLPSLPGLTTTPVRRFAGALPQWEESTNHRPDHAQEVPYDFTVYRVTPAPAG
jgi:hypothetical protein